MDDRTPIRKTARRRTLPPGLLRRRAAAAYCSVGTSTWDRLTAAGLTPAATKLSGACAWSRRELSAWIDHGCPDRATWGPIWQDLLYRKHRSR
jgi:predicted DNA-binding transcriptional regulator AlpA